MPRLDDDKSLFRTCSARTRAVPGYKSLFGTCWPRGRAFPAYKSLFGSCSARGRAFPGYKSRFGACSACGRAFPAYKSRFGTCLPRTRAFPGYKSLFGHECCIKPITTFAKVTISVITCTYFMDKTKKGSYFRRRSTLSTTSKKESNHG